MSIYIYIYIKIVSKKLLNKYVFLKLLFLNGFQMYIYIYGLYIYIIYIYIYIYIGQSRKIYTYVYKFKRHSKLHLNSH